MIGTLATSHTTLNPALRSPAVTHGSVAGQSRGFSKQLHGKFYSDHSLAASSHRKKMEKKHQQKVKQRREKAEKTLAEQKKKIEEKERFLALKRKREQKRREKRFAWLQVCDFARVRNRLAVGLVGAWVGVRVDCLAARLVITGGSSKLTTTITDTGCGSAFGEDPGDVERV